MPLNERNVRTNQMYRGLYGGISQKVTLLKRDPDMRAYTVTAYTLFYARWSRTTKRGQQLDGEDASNYKRTIHIPRSELDRVGVAYINALDRFVDKEGKYWQAESGTDIVVKLMSGEIDVHCFSINPPINI